MKLFIAGLATETNTFSPMPTGLADYVQVRGVPEKDPNSFEAPMSVWKRMARERGWELAESLCAYAPGPACESMTAMAAGGVQMIVFNTGVGNPAANPVAPTIKISGNPATSEKNMDDLDLDVSDVISKGFPIEAAGERIFNEILSVANGKMTVSEILGATQSAISVIGASF